MKLQRRHLTASLFVIAVGAALPGCAALPGQDQMRVNVVGVEPMTGQGMELRLNVKLRIVNPNNTPIDVDGVFLDLDVQGRNFASGASNVKATVPRFGEQVLEVPLTISALGALRQVLGLASGSNFPDKLAYELRGKLGGGVISQRFESKGEFSLSGAGPASRSASPSSSSPNSPAMK